MSGTPSQRVEAQRILQDSVPANLVDAVLHHIEATVPPGHQAEGARQFSHWLKLGLIE